MDIHGCSWISMDIRYPLISMRLDRSVWCKFGVSLGSVWDQFGGGLNKDLISIWCQCVVSLVKVWDQFGTSLGSV